MPGKTQYGNTNYGPRKDGTLGPIPSKKKKKPLTTVRLDTARLPGQRKGYNV